jgi:hypothetical protein
MRAIVLDLTGTLDTVVDPQSFVRNLRDEGNWTILWTGTPLEDVEEGFPGLLETFDQVASKPGQPRPDRDCEEVVFVDDDPMMRILSGRYGQMWGKVTSFIAARDIEVLAGDH